MGRRRRRGGQPHTGLILLDKPQGITSFKAVERVRRALQAERAGHTGTLDPMATGLLPICLGQTTRLAQFVSDADKGYRATVRLGQATDTLDAEGQVVATDDPERVAAIGGSAFDAALAAFRGPIEQRPPAYSAIKVDGERLYAKARRGEEVEVPVRSVVIHRLVLLTAEPPDFTFEVICSKGTYVRTLAADIAESLGVHGHLVALRRTAVAAHRVDDALTLEAIEADADAALARRLSPADAVGHLPAVRPAAELVDHLWHGRRRPLPDAPEGRCRVLDGRGRLVAIVDVSSDGAVEIVRGLPRPDDEDA
ncbi:MAG: tRNA pseudouridine(55) synthase TruB [bacterium]